LSPIFSFVGVRQLKERVRGEEKWNLFSTHPCNLKRCIFQLFLNLPHCVITIASVNAKAANLEVYVRCLTLRFRSTVASQIRRTSQLHLVSSATNNRCRVPHCTATPLLSATEEVGKRNKPPKQRTISRSFIRLEFCFPEKSHR